MLKFHADKFVQLSSTLRAMTMYFSGIGANAFEQERGMVAAELGRITGLLEEVGLNQSVKKVKKIFGQTQFSGYSAAHFSSAISDLQELIQNELEDAYFVCLSEDEAKLFEPKEPLYGKEVDTKFPGLIDEIKEAGRCLGLGRSTAGAFHAIRCLEAGIRAISSSLGIPDPTKGADRNWSNLLREINTEIGKRWPSSTGRMSGDSEVFYQLYGSLAAMQNPYRNATMHFDHSYTPEEAKLIFDIVCGLMKKIASRMDEDGEPKAIPVASVSS